MALVMPLLVLAMPPRQAYAQLSRIPAVAVLDFGVLVDARSSAILGRNATDAIVVEMGRTGKYDVTPRTQVNQQLQELGLTLPLSNNGQMKLGQALGVETIVSGDVTGIAFESNPRRARVSLSVRLTDVVSGELSNGAIQTGYSSAPPAGMAAPDDETLINQALADASFNAIKTIQNYTLPEATVLISRGTSEVTLNRGGRDGIQPGQEMTIIRGRDRIGRVRVTTVNPTDSIATVIDYGKGIRPEDRARAIFKLPGYDVTPDGLIRSSVPDTTSYKPAGRKAKPILTTILAIGAAIFVAYLLFDTKSRTSDQTGIGKVVARAYAEGSVPASLDTAAARVELTWETAPDIPLRNVIEYHIYRDQQIIGVASQNNRTFTDTTSPIFNQVSYNTVTYGGSVGNPNPGNGTTTSATTTTTTTTTTGTNTTGTGTGTGTGGNTNNSGNTAGNSQPQSQLSQVTAPVAPMSAGVTHTYQVTVLFQRVTAAIPSTGGGGTTGGGTTGGGGTGTTGGGTTGGTGTGGGTGTTGNTSGGGIAYQETALRSSSGPVTPVARPAATGPVTAQNIRSFRVNFSTVQGADQYVFEFASDPSFSNKVVRGPFYVQFTAASTASEVFDISRDFPDSRVPAGGNIYYRVGARASNDRPGPLEARNRGSVPSGDNYIYSVTPIAFSKIGTPPAQPGGNSSTTTTTTGSTTSGSTTNATQ